MRQVDCIVVVGELDFEGECVVKWEIRLDIRLLHLLLLLLHLFHGGAHRISQVLISSARLVVRNVSAVAVPAHALPISLHIRVEQRLHSLVVAALGLYQVNNVEPVGFLSSCVRNFEVIPLCVACRAVIVL